MKITVAEKVEDATRAATVEFDGTSLEQVEAMKEFSACISAQTRRKMMIKTINGKTWFCCPECGKKIHPVKPGACGVLVKCTGKNNGKRCDWYGEIKWTG